MKKITTIITIFLLISACSKNETEKQIPEIRIAISPVADSEKIYKGMSQLENLLKVELSELGFNVEKIILEVPSSTQATAEAISSGSALIGYINPITFLLYEEEGIEPLLTGLRYDLNVSSDDPLVWNQNGQVYDDKSSSVSFFYGLIVLGPSEYGLELQAKFNENGQLTWDEISQSSICVGNSVTQTAGYLYPELWLFENYGKSIQDFEHVVPNRNPAEMLAGLASESCDIAAQYGRSRLEGEDKWLSDYAREKSVWDETLTIGVTQKIESSLFVISNQNEYYSSELKEALRIALINISNDSENSDLFSAISLVGLGELEEDFLESSKNAFEFMKELTK